MRPPSRGQEESVVLYLLALIVSYSLVPLWYFYWQQAWGVLMFATAVVVLWRLTFDPVDAERGHWASTAYDDVFGPDGFRPKSFRNKSS